MKFWLSAHWPGLEDEGLGYDVDEECNLWLQDGHEEAGKLLSRKDKVFIYELRTGPTLKDSHVKRLSGRMGVVALAQVISEFEDYEDEPDEYEERLPIYWRYRAQTIIENADGFVPRDEVNRVLGYSLDYTFRGFGDLHSGLKELTKIQFQKLKTYYDEHSQ